MPFPALRRIASFLAVFMLAISAASAGPLDRAKPVGATIGGLLSAPDQTGTARDFASLKGRRGLILIVSRSLRW